MTQPIVESTSPPTLPPALQQQLEQMRPAYIIGLGGTGHLALAFLKRILQMRLGSAWAQKIRLMAFDTADEAFSIPSPNGPVSLEPSAEFSNIGNVPVPSIMRNLQGQQAIRERLGAVMSMLPPVVLRSGAKQLRPFGLLSFLWNFNTVSKELGQSLWKLAGRERSDAGALSQQQGINVFICGSMVGGTGSGTFLDVAHLIRAYFRELGAQAEFCHITGIGVLPQAFHGISGPNLLPNTGAALEELNHVMVKGGFRARYPDDRVVESDEALFNLVYVIDGVDDRGQTWANIHEVAEMIAEAIYLQMGSQLGRKGENAFDNLDEVLVGQSPDGQGNFLGSFGKGELEFNAPIVADICARWFLLELLRQSWLRPLQAETAAAEATALQQALSTDRLHALLRKDPTTGSDISIDLTLPGWLRNKSSDETAAAAAHYLAEYGQARVTETFLDAMSKQGETLLRQQQAQWEAWFNSRLFHTEISLATTLTAMSQARSALQEQAQTAHRQGMELERRLAQQREAVAQMEAAIAKAASGFPLGRANRVRDALNRTFQSGQALYETQLERHLCRLRQHIGNELGQWLQQQHEAASALRERLVTLAQQVDVETGQRARQAAAGGVARMSLADPNYMQQLYTRYKPGMADVQTQIGNARALLQASVSDLSEQLLAALRPSFAPVAALSIEQVIEERRAKMSPRARREQLFRLATPSWNIDRARLPDGGAGLVRLEVLGVPDAARTLFADEPMLVATHDPHRLTALVVVAGAPASALQQYPLYRQAMEQLRNKRPLHVLPAFITGHEQGRLTFALGSIFGLIYSQGTFFYYQPNDPLAGPLKLANGLNNAIRIFIETDGLVNEVHERVEGQIARLGLREAIQVLTTYYSNNAPNGNTPLDEQLRELKRLVRDYTDGLRRIDEFSAGIRQPAAHTS